MTITENVHTISYNLNDSAATMFVSNAMVLNAPGVFKDVMERIAGACLFVEQFALSAHFVTGKSKDNKPVAICYAVVPLEKDIKQVLEGSHSSQDDKDYASPALSFCLYAGLSIILGVNKHLDQNLLVHDTTSIIKWDKHHIVDVCLSKGEHDITTGVFIFKEDDEHYLDFVGSYSSMEDKIINDKGDELDVPKGAKERIRGIYGRELLEKQIREIMGDKEGD